MILCGLGVQRKSVDQLAEELERLLGPDGGLQGTRQHQSTLSSNTSADGEFWNSGRTGGNGPAVAKRKLKNDGDSSSGQPSSGWARRIRGLLFVVIKELVKSLDESLKESGDDEQVHELKSMLRTNEPTQLIPHITSDVEMEEKNGDDSSLGDEEAELGDEFLVTDPTAIAAVTKNTIFDAEEQARRAELVKELLSEEGDSQLSRYQVRGSEKSWNAAVAGHGSELSALHIRVPPEGASKKT